MSVIPKLKPLELFTADEWSRLRRRSNLIGLGLVAHAWAIIFTAGALFIVFPNPLTFLLAWMIIGARQLGLAILMHEAAHGGLSKSQKLNDWVGQWLCAAPIGASVTSYRPYHLKHHKHAQGKDDPDLGLAAHFPITKASLRRKIIRDLTGQTFLKQRTAQLGSLFNYHMKKAMGRSNESVPAKGAMPFLLVNLGLLAALTLAGYWWAYFALWLLPLATWNQMVTRLRNIAEHACLDGGQNPYRVARTTRTNIIEGLLIAPYWVNYHCEHHMFMHLPCYRLGAAHRLLTEKGITDRMEVEDGYWRVLQKATSRPVPVAAE